MDQEKTEAISNLDISFFSEWTMDHGLV